MKKVLLLFVALALVTGSVMAQEEEGIGLTAGLEFGAGNVTEAGGDARELYLMPMVIYENAFLDGALDISAELDYTFGFAKAQSQSDTKVFPQSLYFDLVLGYNFFLSDTSTLSIIVENENDSFILSPRFSTDTNASGVVIPGVKFNQSTGAGDFYVQGDVPLYYIQDGVKDQDFAFGLDFTLGWTSSFGLGIELVEHNTIKPSAGYAGLDAIISYENGSIYAEVEVDTVKEMKNGITITPEFDYSFSSFTFYVNCEFDAVAAESGDITISPALGAKYSF